MGRGRAPWPDALMQRLPALVADGLSASQIAIELGNGITRNGVIGMVRRQGLRLTGKSPGRPRQEKADSTMARLRTRRVAIKRALVQPAKPAAVVFRPPAPKPVYDAPKSLGLSLVDLTADSCRWPYGDLHESGLSFCGHKLWADAPRSGRSYCEAHAHRAVGRSAA